ncbi:MAG TPA: hypothetical protein PLS49_06875 [Candidatus Woesebacteria bacterium]|nr:hypothetical protein [Candidatus Woesebacteria bacterium]
MSQPKLEENIRKTLDLITIISVGVLTELFWDWKILLILVGIYAFFKVGGLYQKLKTMPSNGFISGDDIEDNNDVADPYTKKKYQQGIKDGYISTQLVTQFILTFLIVGGFSSIIKLLLALTLSSTFWLITFIFFLVITIVLILRNIWKS